METSGFRVNVVYRTIMSLGYSTLPELHLVQSPETQPTHTAGLLPYEHSLPLKLGYVCIYIYIYI